MLSCKFMLRINWEDRNNHWDLGSVPYQQKCSFWRALKAQLYLIPQHPAKCLRDYMCSKDVCSVYGITNFSYCRKWKINVFCLLCLPIACWISPNFLLWQLILFSWSGLCLIFCHEESNAWCSWNCFYFFNALLFFYLHVFIYAPASCVLGQLLFLLQTPAQKSLESLSPYSFS